MAAVSGGEPGRLNRLGLGFLALHGPLAMRYGFDGAPNGLV